MYGYYECRLMSTNIYIYVYVTKPTEWHCQQFYYSITCIYPTNIYLYYYHFLHIIKLISLFVKTGYTRREARGNRNEYSAIQQDALRNFNNLLIPQGVVTMPIDARMPSTATVKSEQKPKAIKTKEDEDENKKGK